MDTKKDSFDVIYRLKKIYPIKFKPNHTVNHDNLKTDGEIFYKSKNENENYEWIRLKKGSLMILKSDYDELLIKIANYSFIIHQKCNAEWNELYIGERDNRNRISDFNNTEMSCINNCHSVTLY